MLAQQTLAIGPFPQCAPFTLFAYFSICSSILGFIDLGYNTKWGSHHILTEYFFHNQTFTISHFVFPHPHFSASLIYLIIVLYICMCTYVQVFEEARGVPIELEPQLLAVWYGCWELNSRPLAKQFGLFFFFFKLYLHLFYAEFIPGPWVFVSSVSSGISFSSVQPPLLALERPVPSQWGSSQCGRGSSCMG